MDPEHAFHHVRDATAFEFPGGIELHLPEIAGFQLTKFMILQVVAALATFLIFRGLARRVQTGEPVQGAWWNFWETLALYIRDEVVRPTIGYGHHEPAVSGHAHGPGEAGFPESHGGTHVSSADHPPAAGHPADKYLPFVWTVFFYILFCNLLGAVPWFGSPTGNLNVTGVLALATFVVVVAAGSQASGPLGYWMQLAPQIDVPGPLKIFLAPMIWIIEFVGLLIKHGVLAVRLFANIMAGHTVIAAILGFIAAAAGSWLWFLVAPASIFGQIAIGLLELFVAFLQAYVFAFLATLFISAAVHPH